MSGKSKAKKMNRSGTANKIVGGPVELLVADLPIGGDVLAQASLIKASMTTDSNGREVPNKTVIAKLYIDKLYIDITEEYRKLTLILLL